MHKNQLACYNCKCRWRCITLILSPVSAPRLDLITLCQSLFCVFSLLQYLLSEAAKTVVSNFCQAGTRVQDTALKT